MDSCNDLIPRLIIFDAKDGIDAMPTFDMQSFCFDEDQQISLTIDFKFDTPLDRDVDTTFHWSFDLNESFCFDEEKNKLIKKVILCKKELYNMTRSLRSHAHRHFSFGTTGVLPHTMAQPNCVVYSSVSLWANAALTMRGSSHDQRL